MAFWDKETKLGEFKKNSSDKVIIKEVEKSGKSYIDIRQFYTVDEGENYKPTKKGISIPIEKKEELLRILSGGASTESDKPDSDKDIVPESTPSIDDVIDG